MKHLEETLYLELSVTDSRKMEFELVLKVFPDEVCYRRTQEIKTANAIKAPKWGNELTCP